MEGGPSFLLVGAGSRGTLYASDAVRRHGARIYAIAEPRRDRREQAATLLDVPPERCVASFADLSPADCAAADAAIIATPDRLHTAPALQFIGCGLPLLLEKAMAPTEEEARAIVVAAEARGVVVCVAHVMRYLDYTLKLKALISGGDIGDVVSIEHLEPVGWWHYAHSFVRGNWRNEDLSSPMLLSKSCHDIDWLSFILGKRALRVSSFGSLSHFTKGHQPAGAAARCLDCQVEARCPYSAVRIYLSRLGEGDERASTLSVLTLDRSEAGVLGALREGPYGRCVYDCDNDVVDHQVVNIEYEEDVTASFTMTAFTPMSFRKTRVFGTRGSLEGDGVTIRKFDFLTADETVYTTGHTDVPQAGGGHLGADAALMDAFVGFLRSGDPGLIKTSARESFDTHKIVWAAERARKQGTVEALDWDAEVKPIGTAE